MKNDVVALADLLELRAQFIGKLADGAGALIGEGGALGAELLCWLYRSKILVKTKDSRAVRVTNAGRKALEELFGVRLNQNGNGVAPNH